MKNKIVAVAFISALCCGGVAFAKAPHKKAIAESTYDLNTRTVFLEKQIQVLQNKVSAMEKTGKGGVKAKGLELDSLVEIYAHGPAIVTSPALGVRRSAEDASDLAVNFSSINEDLLLLKLRQKMDNYAVENSIPIPERPIIALSGGIEGEVSDKQGYDFNTQIDKVNKTDINLARAEVDVVAEASPWATGALIISYDDEATKDTRRLKNSRIKLDRGFITLGQLNKFPLYFTIGQIYAPFGSYSSDMVTDPSIKLLGRMKDRMVVLGGYAEGLNVQLYGYSGETKGNNNIFDHSGFNLGYDYSQDKFKLSVAGGMIGNLAESDGMQSKVFAKSYSKNEGLKSRVAGVNGRIKVHYHPFTVRAEYIGALKKFDKADIAFNNDGAKPQAIQAEGGVEFDLLGKTHNFSVGYGHTWQALALELPRDTLFGAYKIAVVKNAILSLEYKHDINYNWTDNAGRKNNPVSVNGRHANTVTANLGIYF